MGLRNYYLTLDDLIEKEGNSKKKIKEDKDELAKKFKKTLEELGFTREMIAWFRSGQKGYYIFAAGDKKEVMKKLDELIAFFDGTYSRPTYNNMCIVINNLQELLPFTKNEGWLDNLPSEQMREIKTLFSLIDEIKEMKTYIEYKGDAKIKKELGRISRNVEKINKSKVIILENLQEPSAEKESGDYNDRSRKIQETVVTSFLKRMNNTYILDMQIVPKEKFYRMIKNWCAVWICLFESIDDLRKAENFYNICELLNQYKKDEDYKKQFFRKKCQMEGEMKEAYAKFQKLSVMLFPEYYLEHYKEKLVGMIRDSSMKEVLKKEFNNSLNYLEDCNAFVQCVGQWKGGESYKEDVMNMKVEALRELDMIIEYIQNDAANAENENDNETIAEDDNKGDREKFLNNYNKYKGTEPISRECLECIFDIKYENGGMVTDYLPYAKEIFKKNG